MPEYEIHPLANLLPLMSDEELSELVDDIRAHGLLHPIVLFDGKILDGRHRFTACEVAEVAPHFTTYAGDSPCQYVISTNARRRHLTRKQLVRLAVESLPDFEAEAARNQGTRSDLATSVSQDTDVPATTSKRARETAAKSVGVSPASVARMKKIKDDAPEVYVAMDDDASILATERAVSKGARTVDEVREQMLADARARTAADREAIAARARGVAEDGHERLVQDISGAAWAGFRETDQKTFGSDLLQAAKQFELELRKAKTKLDVGYTMQYETEIRDALDKVVALLQEVTP